MAALGEYERDIYLLESLYNDNKALLDQHHLDIDLRELAGCAWSAFRSRTNLTRRRIVRDLEEWLNSVNPDLGKKKLPTLKGLWTAGDLREKMLVANAAISSIRNRWQVRGSPVLRTDCADK